MDALSQQTIASAVHDNASLYDVKRVYLFGSYARGEADEASDVDLLVEGGTGFTLFKAGGFGKRMEDALGLPVDIVCREESFYPKALKRYKKDRVLLYEKS